MRNIYCVDYLNLCPGYTKDILLPSVNSSSQQVIHRCPLGVTQPPCNLKIIRMHHCYLFFIVHVYDKCIENTVGSDPSPWPMVCNHAHEGQPTRGRGRNMQVLFIIKAAVRRTENLCVVLNPQTSDSHLMIYNTMTSPTLIPMLYQWDSHLASCAVIYIQLRLDCS